MQVVNVYQAKTNFSMLLDKANKGEEIIIAKAGKPFAMLTPLPKKKFNRKPGALKGKIWIADDFDRYIPEEFLPYIQ